jgi:flagellar L-ring protein precursor FlgH
MRSLISVMLLAVPAALMGQGNAAPTDAAPAAPAPTAPTVSRASWFTDRRPLRVGDILTIVVDEGINARDQQTNQATDNRSLDLSLNGAVAATAAVGPVKAFGTNANASSRNDGVANRDNTLSTTISVRVVSLEGTGNARIEGEKTVTADGRKQLVQLSGLIRPEDVAPDNLVSSSRIADAVITYKGKKIGPSKGILGKLLSIFWP